MTQQDQRNAVRCACCTAKLTKEERKECQGKCFICIKGNCKKCK